MQPEQVTIIGAGAAGIAAAIQLKRWGISPIVLEKAHIGGLLVNANLVENYPGYPQGISGPELVALFQAQMERIGVEVSFEEVLEVDYQDRFLVRTSKRQFASRYLIIASGTSPKPFPEIEIHDDITNRVVSEIHPLLNLTGITVAIVGAGDAAFDYAINLSTNTNKVTILNRTNKRKCLPLLWERCQKLPQIEYVENISVKSMSRSDGGVILECQTPKGDWELKVDYVILAIGRVEQRGFLSTRLEAIVSELESKGILYFAGDVKNGIFRQTSIAVGDGVKAAMKICRKLETT